MKIVKASKPAEAERIERDDRPAIGSWWWVQSTSNHDPDEYDRPGKLWLGCVIEVGSNYVKVKGVRFSLRIALDGFYEARDKTLPELFERVKAEHKAMATWMKADLIPAEAELAQAQQVTEVIEHKIHTVELYAGLQESLVQIREGKPAPENTRVHLMQRRCYMDEECLVKYEAGGMHFKDLKAFDAWIARTENFTRILPYDRCIVAFRVRRHDQKYEGDSLSAFIKLWYDNQESKQTFLYIRNGAQLWRMITSIDFDERLFPDREAHDLLGDHELWVRPGPHIGFDDLITTHQLDGMIEEYQEKRDALARKLWAWHRVGKPNGHWECERNGEKFSDLGDPSRWGVGGRPDYRSYQRLTPENIYHDDAMKLIAKAAFEHNRIAVIVQGLLDRSTCLHPHPPWRIWMPEGFAAGIELVYDDSRVLTPGDAPDFEAYRAQLNKSLKAGSHTIGQRTAWHDFMGEKYGERRDWPYYTNGPNGIHRVSRVKRDGSIEYRWLRNRSRPKWVPSERPGYLKPTYPKIPVTWVCPAKAVAEEIFCVDAYTPGDFHMFYDDPRTRADYLQWAPFLLAAEDWHHHRREHPELDNDVENVDDDND